MFEEFCSQERPFLITLADFSIIGFISLQCSEQFGRETSFKIPRILMEQTLIRFLQNNHQSIINNNSVASTREISKRLFKDGSDSSSPYS